MPGIRSKKVADIYLAEHLQAADPEAKIVTLSEAQLAAKVGTYRDPKTSGTRRLEMRDGQLWAVLAPDFVLPVAATSPEKFEVQGYPVKMEFVDNAGKRELHEDGGSGKPTVYEWVEAPILTFEQHQDFVGNYYSVELDTQYQVEYTANGLVFKHYKHQSVPLAPSALDAFIGLGDLQFTRDSLGKVNGFTWFTGRIRRQRFERMG